MVKQSILVLKIVCLSFFRQDHDFLNAFILVFNHVFNKISTKEEVPLLKFNVYLSYIMMHK